MLWCDLSILAGHLLEAPPVAVADLILVEQFVDRQFGGKVQSGVASATGIGWSRSWSESLQIGRFGFERHSGCTMPEEYAASHVAPEAEGHAEAGVGRMAAVGRAPFVVGTCEIHAVTVGPQEEVNSGPSGCVARHEAELVSHFATMPKEH